MLGLKGSCYAPEHVVKGDLGTLKNNILRKPFIKEPKYREVRPMNVGKAKCWILEVLQNCISR